MKIINRNILIPTLDLFLLALMIPGVSVAQEQTEEELAKLAHKNGVPARRLLYW